MNTLSNWDYQASVERGSIKVSEWKAVSLKKNTLTDDIATDLYEARKELDGRNVGYGNQHSAKIPNGTIAKTWSLYLEEVGLASSTVHRWLEHYEPEEQRLLSDDEYKNKQTIKKRLKMQEDEANTARVRQAIKAGEKPPDWDETCEVLYHRQIKEDADRDARIKKAKDDQDRIAKNREEKYAPDLEIDELLDEAQAKYKEKTEFKEKLGLSGDNADHDFNEILRKYLATLSTDSQKIEACHNIIKICKGVVSDLQIKSVSSDNVI